jgi:transposase
MMPNDLPPCSTVHQQAQRWLKAGVFEAMVHDLRVLLRLAQGRNEQPSAAIFDSRTLQFSPESGERAGYDGAKRRKGTKMHTAVDTLGHLLALHVTPPMNKTVLRCRKWPSKSRTRPNKALRWLLSTKAMPATNQHKQPLKQAFSLSSSNCLTPSTALSCCLVAR